MQYFCEKDGKHCQKISMLYDDIVLYLIRGQKQGKGYSIKITVPLNTYHVELLNTFQYSSNNCCRDSFVPFHSFLLYQIPNKAYT